MYKAILLTLLTAVLLGCGGSASSRRPTATLPTATTPPSSGSTSSASPVGTPAVVQVSAGQAASAVNISVPAPSGTQPNALDLGVANLTGPASAFNTGDAIHRGATMRVVMFGPGLTGDMQVSVLGPNDIQIGNVQAITATDNTPGIAFTVAVTGNAALGARTVVLQTTGGNMTAFTGGLEVVP